MKKRFAAVLLCLCMLLTLTPTVAFAETQGTITDDNGVTLSYEVTSTPQNGAYYTEGEQVVIEVFITNDTSETIYDYKVDNGTTAYGQSLESGKSSGKMSGHFTVSAADVEAGTKSFEVGCMYKLNEQQYGDTLSQTITVLTGRKLEITDLTAVREDGELTVSFESNFAGSYAYALLNAGETAPTDWSGYSKAGVTEGTNSFTVSDTSEATKIVLMLWDENGDPLPNAPAEAEITVSTDPPTLEEGFAALTETATLPYSAEVDLGGEGAVLYDLGDDDFKYGKLLKVEVADGQVLNMDFRGSGESVDTMIEIYRKTPSGQFEDVEYFDNDNSNGYGESVEYILPEAGIYYLAFLRLYEYETGSCRLDISVSDASPIMTIEEGFAALTETATLPYSAEVDLGGEDTVLYDMGSDDVTYGKLLKVEVADGQVLNMNFRGSGERIDTVIEIYREGTSGRFFIMESFDNDNSNGYGESAKYILPEAGVYYLAFLGLDEYETGSCRLDISVSDAPPIMTIEEGFAALTETATLPYSAEVDLGGEGSVLYTVVGDSFYAELLKVELKQGDILRMVFYGADGNYRDTYLEIYQENGSGGFTRLESFNDNNMSGNGESASYTVPEDGVYYLAFEGYDEDVVGLCRLEAELLPAESIATGTLDFTADPAPVPGADALWSWDEESKTLTLKDGFALYNDDPDLGDLILLPDDATVVVEGSATVYNAGYRSIASEGSLTIRGAGAETANLEIVGGDCAIYADDDVIVTGSTVSASGGDVVIYSYDGGVRIENSTITAAPYYMLIGASGDVDIVDSNVSFTGAEIGIIADGAVTLDGGSFTGTFYTGGIGAEKIVLTGEPTLDLTGLDSYSELFRTGSIEIPVEDPVRIYGADGTVLYEGPWDDALFDAAEGMIMVNGTPAAGMEVHRHVYDRQVVSERYLAADATCTEPAKYYFSCECGEMGTETFESGIATGHTAGTAWKSDAAGHWNECAICGEKMNKAAHAYEWVTDKEATAAEAGSRHEECGVCGYVGVTESIAATDPSDSTDSGDKPDSTDDGETSGEPDTGDDGNPALWFALLLASGTAAACIAVYGRRKKRDR